MFIHIYIYNIIYIHSKTPHDCGLLRFRPLSRLIGVREYCTLLSPRNYPHPLVPLYYVRGVYRHLRSFSRVQNTPFPCSRVHPRAAAFVCSHDHAHLPANTAATVGRGSRGKVSIEILRGQRFYEYRSVRIILLYTSTLGPRNSGFLYRSIGTSEPRRRQTPLEPRRAAAGDYIFADENRAGVAFMLFN